MKTRPHTILFSLKLHLNLQEKSTFGWSTIKCNVIVCELIDSRKRHAHSKDFSSFCTEEETSQSFQGFWMEQKSTCAGNLSLQKLLNLSDLSCSHRRRRDCDSYLSLQPDNFNHSLQNGENCSLNYWQTFMFLSIFSPPINQKAIHPVALAARQRVRHLKVRTVAVLHRILQTVRHPQPVAVRQAVLVHQCRHPVQAVQPLPRQTFIQMSTAKPVVFLSIPLSKHINIMRAKITKRNCGPP